MAKSKCIAKPIAMFFLLYVIIHILLNDNINSYSVSKDIVISVLTGFALSLVNICILARKKGWHFWYECLVFWITFAFVQVISAILFYGYFRSVLSHNNVWYKLAYYFPQMVVVLFTIPGAILYHLMGYIATRWLQSKQNT